MPSMRFTDAAVRRIKSPPPPKSISYFETMERGCALSLVVGHGGSRTWRAVRYVDGKSASIRIGAYPQMTVADARKTARAYWENPKAFEEKADAGTFKEVAELWLDLSVAKRGLRSERELRRLLGYPAHPDRKVKGYIYPRWATKKFTDIDLEAVVALLDEVERKHGPSQADATLGVIRQIMQWHASRTAHYVPPLRPKMRRHVKDKTVPKRFLSDDEIRALWAATDDLGIGGRLVRFLLLTGQRRTAASTIERAHLKDGVLDVPRERRRKGTAGTVRLPSTVVAILADLPQFEHNPFLFATTRTPRHERGHFNAWSQLKEELDAKLPADMAHWTFHDLRRTARKLMTRAGVRPDVAELTLGHSLRGLQAIYDDVDEYRPMIEHALECIANEVGKIIDPPSGNVVSMRRASP